MKILLGCPIKERAWAIPDWYDAIERQGIDVRVACIVSPSEDATEELLRERGVIIINDERPGRSVHDIDTHVWGDETTYSYMAGLRNWLSNAAFRAGADYFFSLDSDIILPKGALQKLLTFAESHPGVVAPAVNMVSGIGAPVWNTMQWLSRDFPNRGERTPPPKKGPVDIIMAAMLLDRNAMELCRWEGHGQGEDIGFSLSAYENMVPLWWMPDIKCTHMMRKF